MGQLASRFIWPATLTVILVVAITAQELDQPAAALQAESAATPTNVGATPEPTIARYPFATPVVEEIVIATLALGEPTPDFSLPPDATLDITGTPALAPHTGDGPPEFTIAEIEAYLVEKPHFYADLSSAPLEIVELNVMPAIEAAYVIGGPVYRPEDALVLVVRLEGQFYVNGPPGYVLSGQSSHMVFDARTGNLLHVTVGE